MYRLKAGNTFFLYDSPANTICNDLIKLLFIVLCFLVDGDYIITTGSDRTLKLWAAETGALLLTYSGHSGEVLDARGSCDNG